MGLAISQVRLLALTTRKADIEQKMQIDAKRKQMLTRKASELSQQYYNRLHNAHYQYATSNGYEDLNYSYLMGATDSTGRYTAEFLQQVVTDSSQKTLPQKQENHMILSDQFGQVIVNDQVAEIVEKVSQTYAATSASVYDKTAYALMEFIKANKNSGSRAMQTLYSKFIDESSADYELNKQKLFKTLRNLILNDGDWGGNQDIYLKNGNFYRSKDDAVNQNSKGLVVPQVGHMYTIHDDSGAEIVNYKNVIYDGEGGAGLSGFSRVNASAYTPSNMSALANLVSYFAPIFSAAITNGTSAKVSILNNNSEVEKFTSRADMEAYFVGKVDGTAAVLYNGNSVQGYYVLQGGSIQEVTSTSGSLSLIGADKTSQDETLAHRSEMAPSLAELKDILVHVGDYFIYDGDGSRTYFYCERETSDGSGIIKYDTSNAGERFFRNYTFQTVDNSKYLTANDVSSLQAGFKSGCFQLCMVDDMAMGSYHKNTTMTYFTHRSLVIEKANSEAKEEITAWFNAENASIAEQETYWDAEIQNLSTELNEVKTEIESAKKLKSDSIKSVFNWGGQ